MFGKIYIWVKITNWGEMKEQNKKYCHVKIKFCIGDIME